jgi:putative alpha-1,2-mannosidase
MITSVRAHGGYSYYEQYNEYGYVPFEYSSSATSETLEYAFDDGIVANLALELGYYDDYNMLLKRKALLLQTPA